MTLTVSNLVLSLWMDLNCPDMFWRLWQGIQRLTSTSDSDTVGASSEGSDAKKDSESEQRECMVYMYSGIRQ